MTSDGKRWGAIVDKLRMTDTATHESNTVRGPLRVSLLKGRPLYVQPTFQWRPGATPALIRVAALTGDSVHVGATLPAALGATPRRPSDLGAAPALRLRADSLYRVMRDALVRGDWTTFGRAFDALGLALRVTGR
jgi:uncharacterized membrane protein (UPF0182 family)